LKKSREAKQKQKQGDPKTRQPKKTDIYFFKNTFCKQENTSLHKTSSQKTTETPKQQKKPKHLPGQPCLSGSRGGSFDGSTTIVVTLYL